MPAFAYPESEGSTADAELRDARESLVYWERRARTLPVRAVRKRREAREMAVRSQARVAQAERAAYGRGLAGAVLLLLAERRLPQSTRHAARTVARHATRAAVTALVVAIAVLALGLAAAIELLGAML